MQKYIYTGPEINQLEMIHQNIPEVPEGYIRIHTRAVALNPYDSKMHTLDSLEYPVSVGLDASGEVDAVGEGVQGFSVGDKVICLANPLGGHGSFAEYTLSDARACVRIPEGIQHLEATSYPCAGVAAYEALVHRMQIHADDTVLIHGAAGGVGSFAVQIAKIQGSRVIACTSKSKRKAVEGLMPHEILFYEEDDLHASVLSLTKNLGADKVLNTISAQSAMNDVAHLAFGGHLASLSGGVDTSTMVRLAKAYTLHGFQYGRGVYRYTHPRVFKNIQKALDQLLQWHQQEKIYPLIDSQIDWQEIPSGLERLSQRKACGKIVASLPD